MLPPCSTWGRDEEARARLALGTAVWPLCAASVYGQAEHLAKAGRPVEADERFDLALRLLTPGDRTASYVLREWHHALRDTRPLSAARAWRRHVLLAGPTSLDYGPVNYTQAAAQLHFQQVRDALAMDQLESASAEARLAQAAAPGDAELTGELVNLFDRAGHVTAGDEVALHTHQFLSALAKRFPESALHQHLLACLALLTRRRLDEAQPYISRAIAIDPDQPDFYGTLAQIEVARGNRAAARAAAEAGLKLEPNHTRCAAVLAELGLP